MSKLFLAAVIAVVLGFGFVSVDSTDVTTDKMPRCTHTPWGCV